MLTSIYTRFFLIFASATLLAGCGALRNFGGLDFQ